MSNQSINKIFLHWSGTPYGWQGRESNGSPAYHNLFDNLGISTLKIDYHVPLYGHTYRRNSNSVALSCACLGKGPDGEPEGFEGLYPPTKAQINSMCLEAAKIVVSLGWHVPDTWDNSVLEFKIMTHAEAGGLRDYPLTLVSQLEGDNDQQAWDLKLPHSNYGISSWVGAPIRPKWPGGSVVRWDWSYLQEEDSRKPGIGGYMLRKKIFEYVIKLRKSK